MQITQWPLRRNKMAPQGTHARSNARTTADPRGNCGRSNRSGEWELLAALTNLSVAKPCRRKWECPILQWLAAHQLRS
eukprot:5295248-Alexandrium_andersonii.AAC.1